LAGLAGFFACLPLTLYIYPLYEFFTTLFINVNVDCSLPESKFFESFQVVHVAVFNRLLEGVEIKEHYTSIKMIPTHNPFF
jgi:hypothetical protein